MLQVRYRGNLSITDNNSTVVGFEWHEVIMLPNPVRAHEGFLESTAKFDRLEINSGVFSPEQAAQVV
jgi:hypothetical protein